MIKNNKITCMLVDDDIEDREFFKKALDYLQLDIDFVTENNGIRALERIKSDDNLNPFFIFIDINMPKMSGMECLIEMKKIEKILNTQIYLYSTWADAELIEEGKEQGAEDVLLKANSMKELQKMISQAILPEIAIGT